MAGVPSTWNFRVVKKGADFAIYSAYYDHNGELKGLSESPESLDAEDVESLRETLALMIEACDKPVVEYGEEIGGPARKST